jgi:hypothetical protein
MLLVFVEPPTPGLKGGRHPATAAPAILAIVCWAFTAFSVYAWAVVSSIFALKIHDYFIIGAAANAWGFLRAECGARACWTAS